MQEYTSALQALDAIEPGLLSLLTQESRDLLDGALDYSGLVIQVSGDIVRTIDTISDYVVNVESRVAFVREQIQFAVCNRF